MSNLVIAQAFQALAESAKNNWRGVTLAQRSTTTTKVELRINEGGERLRQELVEFLTESSTTASFVTRDGDKIVVQGDEDGVVEEMLDLLHADSWEEIVIAYRLNAISKLMTSLTNPNIFVLNLSSLTWLDATKYGAVGTTIHGHKKAIKSATTIGSIVKVTPRGALEGALEAVADTLEHRARWTDVSTQMRVVSEVS